MGSAVGLANIWRFPYTAGVSGGGAFVLIYIAAVLLLALPILIAELMIGRRGAAPPPGALSSVARESGHSRHWGLLGIILGGIGAIVILAFYSVVGGWTMAYVFKIGSGSLQGITADTAQASFDALNAKTLTMLAWFTAFIGVTLYISSRGLHAGVEKAVNLMMPALLIMLIVMVFYSLWVGDAGAALAFLFTPDFSQINSRTVMAAFGQAFFSVSVGATNIMAYGAYIKKSTSIPRSALIIVSADTGVALLAGLAIFPIIFAFGLEPGAGPGLVFITMPFTFGQVPGGWLFGSIFFLLLLFAALTSSISMMEAPVSWLSDRTRLSRGQAAILSGGISWCLGILAVLSLNRWANFFPLGNFQLFAGKTFFDLFDFFVTNLLLPFGGIVIAIFAGWMIRKKFSSDELYGSSPTVWFHVWLFLARFFAPVILILVFMDLLN